MSTGPVGTEPASTEPGSSEPTSTESTVEGSPSTEATLSKLVFGSDGLLPAIVQDDDSERVLMLAWMDAEAVRRTLTSGRVTYWSRSRQEYWRKGDTSGHRQYVRRIEMDCDGDTLLVRVEQLGAACHTGTRSCFDGRGVPATVGDPRTIG